MPQTKKKVKKKKNNKKGFPGLFSSAFMLMIVGLALVITILLPVPDSVTKDARPSYENFKRHDSIQDPIESSLKTCSLNLSATPMLAIIIDDMGYDLNIDSALITLEAPISFAFLPYAPHTAQLASMALKKNRDVLVHLPMEPLNPKIDPGPGSLSLNMDQRSTVNALKKNIDAVPGASGVNNHMGSRYCADEAHISWIMDEIGARRMFFVDSRTTKETVAYDVAVSKGIAATWRDVFLDHKTEETEIKFQLERAVKLAINNGSAVAIGHPYPQTLGVLYRQLPVIRKYVRIVPVHKLLCRVRK